MPSESFGAYYTHLETDAPFEQYSRTGEYADIIVDLGPENGKLVFWRGSSYLPYWEPAKRKKEYLREIVKRSGDGSGRMTDRINLFSFVKVLSDDRDSVCILWRYNPFFNGGNPRTGVESRRAVEEYFTVRPSGRVSRRIMSGKDIYTQELLLTQTGIKTISLSCEAQSFDNKAVNGEVTIAGLQEEPVLWFRFDEGAGDMTREAVSGKSVPVNGIKAYWRQGVSGTALQFDDVSSSVEFDADLSGSVKDEITIEAWAALGAYPWNWCPLIQQTSDSGFYLGINGDGRAGLKLKTGGKWEEMVAGPQLERWKWYHIIGTYSDKDGKMCIYSNGELMAEKQVSAPGPVELSDAPVKLGRGEKMRPMNPVRESTYPAGYSLDGLLDEVRIYDRAFTPRQVGSSYRAYNPDARADMPARILPGISGKGGFGARYSRLLYYDTWDNLFRFGRGSDVTVSFDGNPASFIFWRGVSYIPMMVNGENQWYSNEFNETWGTSGGSGCQEPMSDKASDISHVRIIENTPARVVVHWRYALPDVNYVLANYDASTGWCDMADWYYYIYPDGVAACRKRLWTSGERNHEWQESMVIFGPDQHPYDILERHSALRMIGEDGTVGEYEWIQAPPENISYPQNANIQQVNFRSDYDPFIIGTNFEGSNVYNGELTPYAVFSTWNHWPIAQIPSDGRYATFPDRTAHSSLSHIFLPVFREGYGDRPFVEKLSLEGMWNSPAEELVSLSRSWTHAPELAGVSGADWEYLQEQRAYLLNVKEFPVSFMVNASAESPVCNLCFVLKGWNDRREAVVDIPGAKVSQGTVRDTDGSFTKIIFVHFRGSSPQVVSIDKEQF